MVLPVTLAFIGGTWFIRRGNEGVEKIEEIALNENEKTEFNNSVEAVIKLWDAASKIDPDLNKD